MITDNMIYGKNHNVMLNHHCEPTMRFNATKTRNQSAYFKPLNISFQSKGNIISSRTLCWQVRDFSDNWGADRTMFLVLWPKDFPLLCLRFSRGATCHGSSRRKYLTACYSSPLAPLKDLVRDRWACLLE